MKRFNLDHIHFSCITTCDKHVVANGAGTKSKRDNFWK